MTDLTIIYLTLNKLPQKWQEYQWNVFKEAAGGASIIRVTNNPAELSRSQSVSEPGSFMVLIQDEPPSANNIYRQMLRAAKIATTEFVAVAEDDTLYVPEHFGYRPKKDEFAYNCSHWSLFTWPPYLYGWRNRKGNYAMICNRKLLVEALEERFAKYPNGTPPELTGELGRWRSDNALGLTQRKAVDFYTNNPIINVNHEFGLDDRARRRRKTYGTLRAYDIPTWGKAEDLVKKFQ